VEPAGDVEQGLLEHVPRVLLAVDDPSDVVQQPPLPAAEQLVQRRPLAAAAPAEDG
jgi:hypothetical protein